MGTFRIADAMSSRLVSRAKCIVQEFRDRAGHVSLECFHAKRDEEAVIFPPLPCEFGCFQV